MAFYAYNGTSYTLKRLNYTLTPAQVVNLFHLKCSELVDNQLIKTNILFVLNNLKRQKALFIRWVRGTKCILKLFKHLKEFYPLLCIIFFYFAIILNDLLLLNALQYHWISLFKQCVHSVRLVQKEMNVSD